MIAPVDVTNIRLVTERLHLRPWIQSDLADFYEYASVDGVGQMAGWLPHRNIEESQTILNNFIAEKKTLALEWKQTGRSFDSLPGMGRELGYVLSKEYWGRGLMPEAVTAVMDYCFRVLGYDYLGCAHFVWNDQSRRVIEKCGFQFWKESSLETRLGTVEKTKLYIYCNPEKTR